MLALHKRQSYSTSPVHENIWKSLQLLGFFQQKKGGEHSSLETHYNHTVTNLNKSPVALI